MKQFSLVAGLLLVIALAACSTDGTSVRSAKTHLQIMVGGLDKQIYLPNILARQLGYFDEEGLAITLIDEASGQSSEDSVLGGQVEAGSGSYDHTVELQAAGKNLQCVVQLDIAPGEAEMVSTKVANQVKSISDLKGRNLGVTELGSGTHNLTIALLDKAGLPKDQVHFLPVGAGETFIAAMQQGRIDAGMTTEPTISRLLATGTAKVLVDLRTPEATQAALGGPYPFICIFMKNDYINAHKDMVQKLVNSYVKTLHWIHSHNAEEIAAKVPVDYYAGDKALYITALQDQLSLFSLDGKMPDSGPQFVLSIEKKTNPNIEGKQINLALTFTNEFVSKVGN